MNEQVKKTKGCFRTIIIMLVTVIISVVVTFYLVNYYLFPKKFDSVNLNVTETSVLNDKLNKFGLLNFLDEDEQNNKIQPEKYTEVGASREVNFTEKELNALLAKKTDLSEQIAIDLSTDLASVKAIIKLDEDFPFLGGKSLTVSAGAKLAYESGRPIVILKGVKLWGVPLPNAWLGDLKNIDLVKEFGGDEGFWQSFADGIEHIKVSEGVLNIKLKE